MPELDIEELTDSLRNNYWRAFRGGKWSTRKSVHEKVKADLCHYAFNQGFHPIPEIDPEPYNEGHNLRVDVGWKDREDHTLKVAFEVDGGVSSHSVDKLKLLPGDIEKVIVSKSPNKTYLERSKPDVPEGFHHIDVQVWK